ncbi:type II toxin-antitoxin system VapC family toxin [Patescibacteria group bacterium]|nr:type II toxin-antitoxin system VapC family toxin [Patescibacteria group bacterium]
MDTNILVAYLNAQSQKHSLVRPLFERISDGELSGFISSQNILELSSVLQNTYHVDGTSISVGIEKLISELTVIYPNQETINIFSKYLKSSKLHVMDLFLMATAQAHTMDFLVSEDKHFSASKEVKIYNPFR